MPKKKLQGAKILDLEATIKVELEGSALSGIIPGKDEIINNNQYLNKM